MTTLVQDIKTLLDTLTPAGGTWYQVNTTEPPVYPFIVFNRIFTPLNVAFDGPSDLQNTRVQIDIYSQSVAESVAIETTLEAAMLAWSVSNVPLSSQDTYEPDIKARRIIKDYSVWATN
jgi:hypothetical protein